MGKYSINKLPSDVLKDLADKIKVIRKKEGLSQQLLAKKSGVSYGSVKRFETTGQISLESLLKLTHVLGRLMDFDKILNQDKEESKEYLFGRE